MNQQEREALATEMAGRRRTCHCWHVIDRNEGRTETIRWAPEGDCPDCHGTGEVYVFDGSVRVPCHQIHSADHPSTKRPEGGAPAEGAGAGGATCLM